ncbi:MAG TPA: VOC family protein [Candidatus Acidoferrales bacterium]|nr:VOC family protein [Candidatus Acidoferrales bacterium]
MWGNPPFFIPDNCAIDVRNLSAASAWYKEKLRLHEVHDRDEDDSGRPFVDLSIEERNGAFLTLVELEPGAAHEKRHFIFYAKRIEKAHEWLAGRGVVVEPPTTDSGGNHFFRFYDLEGNAIEVCIEPG